MAFRLSKSKFTTGLQCHKQLWWKAHEPKAPELVPDPMTLFRFQEGTRVGEEARSWFPGGELIDHPHFQAERRVAATREALDSGAPSVHEATFVEEGVYVAVDILERTDDGFVLVEVKSSTRVRDHHITDAAVQTHVVEAAGIPVVRTELMHLNSLCRFPELGELFVRQDISGRVRELMPSMPGEIGDQLRMLDGALPDIQVGPHCADPYECPFRARCWPERPPHHVSSLYRMVQERKDDLVAGGIEEIDRIPTDYPLSVVQARQRTAAREGRLVVEGDLLGALAQLSTSSGRIGFLDFETVGPAIPVWPGCGPWQQVPVQFSCHVTEADGSLDHFEWIARGPEDPRPEQAERLVAALAGAGVVAAYNAAFEKRCLDTIAVGAPELSEELGVISDRLVDLLPVVRNHIYHPDFRGSFSLKRVLPALVPGLGYDEMEIGGGQLASVELHRLMFQGESMAEGERSRLEAALLEYCRLDTFGLVQLLEMLRGLAGSEGLTPIRPPHGG
jgi:hypothetical protein